MHNMKWVLPPLLLFLALLTYPLWAGSEAKQPVLAKAKGEQCVESAQWMRANHMQLLDDWRHSVVRDQSRTYVSTTGKHFEKSLSNTCLECHDNKEEFCEACHGYASVKPYCWECHVDPNQTEVSDVR